MIPGWNLVLSYGDLSHRSGYRTRVLGELQHLDNINALDPFLLLFDRRPEQFELASPPNHRAIPRSEFARFLLEVNALHRRMPVRVVHAHNLYSALLAMATRRFYGYRVVLDYHSRVPEGGRTGSMLELLEERVIQNVDHVIAASRALGRYLITRYGLPGSRLSVIPCCADSIFFKLNSELRDRTRAELGLTDRLVCTHLEAFSSRMIRIGWFEHSMKFEHVTLRHTLLTITAGQNEARTFLERHLAPGTFTVISAAHQRVPALLNASDMGFLLLRPSPSAETSSPAKFAEYLNCGVPVIITAGVGDYSSLVRNKGLGEILKESTVSDKLIQAVLHSRSGIAERCVQGGQELTWLFHRDTAKYVF